MVNIGKPSSGCYLCRARRVKCDETKPGCLKCRKINRDCPGYRDPRTARIRDETSATIDKAVKAAARRQTSLALSARSGGSLRKHPTVQSDVSTTCQVNHVVGDGKAGEEPASSSAVDLLVDGLTTDLQHDASPTNPSSSSWNSPVPLSLDTGIYYEATCFFLSSFVLLPSVPGQRGAYTFVQRMLNDKNGVARCFTSAFQAASLGALSTLPAHRKLRSLAYAQYLKALGEVQRAVNDPETALGSQTLASILLLALYETLASPSKELAGFEAHVRGATQLIRMRGSKQVESPEGLELVIVARSRFLLLHSLPGSNFTVQASEFPLLNGAVYPDAFGTLTPLINEHARLRDEVSRALERRRGAVAVFARILSLLRATMAMARKFQTITQNCPPEHLPVVEGWAFWEPDPHYNGYTRTVSVPPSFCFESEPAGDATGHPVYGFSSHWAATFHASCHSMSLIMLHAMCRCLAYLSGDGKSGDRDYRTKTEYFEAQEIASRAVANVVAAAAYLVEKPFTLGAAQSSTTLNAGTKQQLPSRGTVTSVMSVLMTAMASDFASDKQRQYLRSRLLFLTGEGGIAQAESLAKRTLRVPHDDIERDRRRGRLA